MATQESNMIIQHSYVVINTRGGGSPYKSCVSYVRRKIVDLGPVFQKRRGPTSTTIRVQFLHLLENKGEIARKSPLCEKVWVFGYGFDVL